MLIRQNDGGAWNFLGMPSFDGELWPEALGQYPQMSQQAPMPNPAYGYPQPKSRLAAGHAHDLILWNVLQAR
jgi:hypothetical protein